MPIETIPQSPFTQIWGDREANTVLGWYALYKDNVSHAIARLFSARRPSPVYFGSSYCFMDPLMDLVRWMLDWGQRDAVLKYLARDQGLVPEFRERLAKWSSEIEQGRAPDFQDRALLAANVEVAKKFVTRSKWTPSGASPDS